MPSTLKPLACLFLLFIALAPGVARGQGPRFVIDGAEMFSKDAVEEATLELSKVNRDYEVTVTVETVESLRGQGIDEVAIRNAEKLSHRGIYVLIAKKDRKAETLASPRTLREELGVSKLNAIRDAFTEEFGKGRVDAGLI